MSALRSLVVAFVAYAALAGAQTTTTLPACNPAYTATLEPRTAPGGVCPVQGCIKTPVYLQCRPDQTMDDTLSFIDAYSAYLHLPNTFTDVQTFNAGAVSTTIKLTTGAGTSGKCWVSSDTLGNGAWTTCPGGPGGGGGVQLDQSNTWTAPQTFSGAPAGVISNTVKLTTGAGTAGKCWMSSDTLGNGSWQTCGSAILDQANTWTALNTFNQSIKVPTNAATGKIFMSNSVGLGAWDDILVGCFGDGAGLLTCSKGFVSENANTALPNYEQIMGNASVLSPPTCASPGTDGTLTIVDTDNGASVAWDFCSGPISAVREERRFFPAGYNVGGTTLTAGDAVSWRIWDSNSPAVNPSVVKLGTTYFNSMVLRFNDANDCTGTTLPSGACIGQIMRLPSDWTNTVPTGAVDVEVIFLSGDTTSGNTIKWTAASVCATPDIAANADVNNPTNSNAVSTATYTNAASGEDAAKFRRVKMSNIDMTGCAAGDLVAFRIGRYGTSDTSTSVADFYGAEITWRRKMQLK